MKFIFMQSPLASLWCPDISKYSSVILCYRVVGVTILAITEIIMVFFTGEFAVVTKLVKVGSHLRF